MNGVEYRNLCDLAEHAALDAIDRAAANQALLLNKYGSLSDAMLAEISWIRACAARPSLRAEEDLVTKAWRRLGKPRPPPDDPTKPAA
jgi:hypothetical protein